MDNSWFRKNFGANRHRKPESVQDFLSLDASTSGEFLYPAMRTLEQVFGKVKQHSDPTRVMQAKSDDGDFQLIWKLKHGHWFLITGSKGWNRIFALRNNEIQTEAAFRMWCCHSRATFHCEPDNHPPFRNLSSIQRTTTFPPRSDGNRSLNRVHAQARPL